ncbi:MAG: hypothetical protein GQ558_07790 [Thermoplasmata archaeon]|nr:hypothetical protein [Thermoplasmata archaeon]
MSILGGKFLLGGVPLVLLASTSLVSPMVSATSIVDPYYDLVRASVLAIPLRGILVVALVTVFYIFSKDPPHEPAWFHISNILVAIMLLTLIDAFTAPLAFLDLRHTTFAFTILGLIIMFLYTLVFSRYLLFPLSASAVVGAAFAGISILWWNHLLSLTDAQVDDKIELLAYLFLGGMFIMLSILFLETVRNHLGHGKTPDADPDGADDGPSIHERTLRMGEMLLACTVLGIVTLYLWQSL